MSVVRLFYFPIMAALLIMIGFAQSWNVAFGILNLCLISAIMSLGVNIQWGYAGLFNVGTMGFAAVGGLAAVLVSVPPVKEAWAAGGGQILLSGVMVALTVLAVFGVRRLLTGAARMWATAAVIVIGYTATRWFFDPGVEAVESYEPAATGFLGGLGLPIIFSWAVGGLFAAAVAWMIGKITLGLRSDYLAIATLGISEIIVFILKSEDWLDRGVKNVTGLGRPVPYEVDLVNQDWFVNLANSFGADVTTAAAIFVKLCYALLFVVVLAAIMWLSERALNSPWGRMMRAIRDNRDAASAMGKNVTARHLQAFVIGSAVCGIAGAMLTTLDGQFTPTAYIPLRYTFLIWVMVIVGGSGNNWGAVLGGFLIWFLWVEAEPAGHWLIAVLTYPMPEHYWLRDHLQENAAHMRMIFMGLILILVMRYNPRGLLPERRGG